MSAHDMIKQLADKAAAMKDQTEVTSGGDFEYELPPAGKTIGRFVTYIEIGKQKQPDYQGKSKPDAEEVIVGFELLHPKKNIHTVEIEGEGEKTFADYKYMKMALKQGEKAKFRKLLMKMLYGRDGINHMAQMLGEGFLIEVFHKTSEDGKKTYANLENEGEWGIGAPFSTDPLTEERKAYPIGPNIRPLTVFIWDFANKETWDSLFIDGTRKTKVDGKEVEVSKNWIQNLIKGAKNYEGSPIHQLLSEVPDLGTKVSQSKAEEALDALDSKVDTSAEDLAALGL